MDAKYWNGVCRKSFLAVIKTSNISLIFMLFLLPQSFMKDDISTKFLKSTNALQV